MLVTITNAVDTVFATSRVTVLLEEYRQDHDALKIRSGRDAERHLLRVNGASFISTSGVVMLITPIDI